MPTPLWNFISVCFWISLSIQLFFSCFCLVGVSRLGDGNHLLFVLGNPVECWLENEPLYGYIHWEEFLHSPNLAPAKIPESCFSQIRPLDTYVHISHFWLRSSRCTLRPYYCREHSIRANRWLHFCGSLTGAQRGKGGRFSRWWFQMFQNVSHIPPLKSYLPSQ